MKLNNGKTVSKRNIKALVKLAKKYKSISLKDIRVMWEKTISYFMAETIANKLTGYGDGHTCIVCKTCKYCDDCFWSNVNSCCNSHFTYDRIRHAETPGQLRRAFQARSRHIIKQLCKNIPAKDIVPLIEGE